MHALRHHVLRDMLVLETAASNWFSGLGEREQDAYLRAHPASKFAKDRQASRLSPAEHHERLAKFHEGKSGADHKAAAELHRDAQSWYTGAGARNARGATLAGRAAKAANSKTRSLVAADAKGGGSVSQCLR